MEEIAGSAGKMPAAAQVCRTLAILCLGFVLPVLMVVVDKSAPAVFGAAALAANLAAIFGGRRSALARRCASLASSFTLLAVLAVLMVAIASFAWTIDAAITRRGIIEAVPELAFALAASAAFPLIARPGDAVWLVAGILAAGLLILFERCTGLPLHILVGARADVGDLKRSATVPVLLVWPALAYCLVQDRRWLALPLYAAAALGVIAAHSAAPLLSLIAAGGVCLLARRAPHAAIGFSATALLILIAVAPWTGTLMGRLLPPVVESALRDEHALQRIRIWSAFETRLHDRPLLGHGFNSSFKVSAAPLPGNRYVMSDEHEIDNSHPHDVVLQIWVELGLAGALMTAALTMSILHRLKAKPALEMAPRLALLVVIVGIGIVGFSAWQPWWLASIAASLLWFDLIERETLCSAADKPALASRLRFSRMAIGATDRMPIAMRLAFAAGLALVILIFVLPVAHPNFPGGGLDPSWMTVTGEMPDTTRWGMDLIFTYGPAAAIPTLHYNSHYLSRTVPFLALIAAAFGLAASCLVFSSGSARRPWTAGAVAVSFAAVTLLLGRLGDAIVPLQALGLLVFITGAGRQDRLGRTASALGAFALGTVALTKFSYAVPSFSLLLLLDAVRLTERRLPLHLLAMLAGLMVTSLAYHQRLADLPVYLSASIDVAGGFAEAMGTRGNWHQLVLFLAGAAALISVTGFAAWTCRTWQATTVRRMMMPTALALSLFVFLKAGYVRNDPGHALTGDTGLLFAALCCGASLRPASNRLGLGMIAIGVLYAGIVIPLDVMRNQGISVSAEALGDLYAQAVQGVSDDIGQAAAALAAPGAFIARESAAEKQAWEAIRLADPLPRLEGTVDMIPSEQSAVLANGLDYRPRPSFQEYGTYTEQLSAANQTFFTGPAAPDWLLFAPGSIDGRMPASAEGASWPIFLNRYQPERMAGDYLALRRRAGPASESFGPWERRQAILGSFLPLDRAGPVFAKIEVRRTMLGEIANLLFHPPALRLTVKLRDGSEITARLLRRQAKTGMLISPYIENTAQFARLACGLDAGARDRDVVAVRIDGNEFYRWFYAETINVGDATLLIPAITNEGESETFCADVAAASPL